MRVAATVEIPGPVYAIASGGGPPPEGAVFRVKADGSPGALYLDGQRVGELIDWPAQYDTETIMQAGDRGPGETVVLATTLKCWLYLPLGPPLDQVAE